MTKRFNSSLYSNMVIDMEHKIPSMLCVNEEQKNEFLNGLNALHEENEQLKEREERLLNEIEDFQELLSKNDNVCHDRVIMLIEEKLAFLWNMKGELINEDSYRLRQISFAINLLNELKKELKNE